MIGTSRHRETVRLLQDDAAALRVQLATLAHQIETLSAQLAAQQDRISETQARATRLESQVAGLDGIVTAQALLIDAQTGDLERLQVVGERREEQIMQVRGDVARLERQAALDLDEMRKADMAIAASMLLKQPLVRSPTSGETGES